MSDLTGTRWIDRNGTRRTVIEPNGHLVWLVTDPNSAPPASVPEIVVRSWTRVG